MRVYDGRLASDPGRESSPGLAAEASQEPELALERGRGVRAAGDRGHERRSDPGCVDRERPLEQLLVVASVGGESAPGFGI